MALPTHTYSPTTWAHDWPTWDCFLTWAATAQPSSAWSAKHTPSSDKSQHRSWTDSPFPDDPQGNDVTSVAAATALAREGWTAGEQRARSLSDQFLATVAPYIQREEFNPDVHGVTFDVGTLLTGTPDHWLRLDTVESPDGGYVQRHCSILLNGAVSASVDSAVIVARGACVAALVHALTVAGVATTVTMLWRTGPYQGTLCLKTSDQDLDLARIAFCTAHPAMFRRLIFRSLEETCNTPARAAQLSGNYGVPNDPDPLPACDVYLGRMLYGETQWTDPAAADAWIKEQLRAFGVLRPDGVTP